MTDRVNDEDIPQTPEIEPEDVSQVTPPKKAAGRPKKASTIAAKNASGGTTIVAETKRIDPVANDADMEIIERAIADAEGTAVTITDQPVIVPATGVERHYVPIVDIVMNHDLQPRERINESLIEEYIVAMSEGDVFPPIELVRDGDRLLLADGWHRLKAAIKLANETIFADIYPGGMAMAKIKSAGANARHGLRRSNGDKRRAVVLLLSDAEHRTLSDGAIAQIALVSARFVGMVREDLIKAGMIESNSVRVGKDGRARDIATMQTSKPLLEQPRDPIKDEPSEFDNPDDPDAELLQDEAPVRYRGDEITPEQQDLLDAFDAFANLSIHTGVTPIDAVAIAAKYRKQQLDLVYERVSEIADWVVAVEAALVKSEELRKG